MVLRLLFSVLGIFTVKMPSLNDAFALASSTLSGKDNVLKFPPRYLAAEIFAFFFFLFFFLGGSPDGNGLIIDGYI